MRITTIIIRTLVGLLMLFASLNYFFHFAEEPVFTGQMKVFSDGIAASGYLMPLAKILELLCGLSFVTGKFTKLFGIVLLPITVNIFFIKFNSLYQPIFLSVSMALSSASNCSSYSSRYLCLVSTKAKFPCFI